MIITEFYREREDCVNLYRTFSDAGFRIENEQTHEVFDEVINVEGFTHTYIETDVPIEEEGGDPQTDEATAMQILNVLLGGGGG